ncbi:hypothetical protein LINPERPRIM_LOCUS454 [Linum perenne]
MDSEENFNSLLSQTSLLSVEEPTINLAREPNKATETANRPAVAVEIFAASSRFRS